MPQSALQKPSPQGVNFHLFNLRQGEVFFWGEDGSVSFPPWLSRCHGLHGYILPTSSFFLWGRWEVGGGLASHFFNFTIGTRVARLRHE
ncbi:hypothetical protein FKM82_011696 [Ascaphus truei]